MQTSNQQWKLKHLENVKNHGYQLTEPVQFIFPNATSNQTIIKSIFNLFTDNSYEKQIFSPHSPKYCTVLNEKIALLFQSNKLIILFYNIINDNITIEKSACYLLKQHIHRIVCPYYWNVQRVENYQFLAIQYVKSARITLFKIDQYQNILQEHQFKEDDEIVTIRFISGNEIMTVLKNLSINHYYIKDNRFKSSKLNLKLYFEEKSSELTTAEICTTNTGNEVKICLFYTIYQSKHQRYHIHLKQFRKDTINSIIQVGTFYDIFAAREQNEMLQKVVIYSHKGSLLIHCNLTIFIVQKYFGKYVRSDVISQLGKAKRLIIIDKRDHIFICSISESQIELWEVKMKDVGCHCNLLDVIQLDGSIDPSKIIKAWIFVMHKKPEFVLMTDHGIRSIQFYLTKKKDKLKKLVNRVRKVEGHLHNKTKDQRNIFLSKLTKIEELSSKLGFNRKQFYLKLWQEGQKNSVHIFEYLIPCMDIKVIFNEITLYLRVKTLSVTQIIRILKRIEKSILSQLQKTLDLQLIRQLLKTNFQRRKLKLYNGDVQLDFQQYQDIYQSSIFQLIHKSIDLELYPSKFKHDIVWKEQIIEKPIYIPYILREFRLIILEDYQQFLLTLIEPYKYSLKTVIEKFPFILPQYPLKISIVREELVMLSNIYNHQKIQEQQHSWLSFIRQNQLKRQVSSFDFLAQHLFNHHTTSSISDQLKQFREGVWCSKYKYSKHILLYSRKDEFQSQLPIISDATSLLFICEKANRISLKQNIKCQSEQILEIMYKHNNLPFDEYHKYKLYCKLHYILIKQNLIDTEITIHELIKMQVYKIISYFFLGDRERIDLLFTVIYKFYPHKNDFHKIIQAFIASQQCSKVELQILVNYIKQLGQDYQKENQQLLGIIINGFMRNIEIRQIDKAIDFNNLFKKIALSEDLLIKISIFESIQQHCNKQILKFFQMSNFTYFLIMNNPEEVIKKLVHTYFKSIRLSNKIIYIEGRQINLNYAQNLFVIFLYLKDKIYSYNSQLDLYIIFCQAIIEWNQFQLFKECFREEITIDNEQYTSEQFYVIVVDNMLNKYYDDEQFVYNKETKLHIKELLELIQPSSETYVVQYAKIGFVEIMEKFNQTIRIQYMQLIKEQWQNQELREGLFKEIIDLLGDRADFKVICNIYQFLQKIKYGKNNVVVKTRQFIQFADYLCRKMAKKHHYSQICEIIYFLNKDENQFKVKYSLMTQCFLEVIINYIEMPNKIRQTSIKLDKLSQCETYKVLIDYYINNYYQIQKINELFENKFLIGHHQLLQNDQINVDEHLLMINEECILQKDAIWRLVIKTIESYNSVQNMMALKNSRMNNKSNISKGNHQKNAVQIDTKSILFTYYFITKLFTNCQQLMQLEQISYEHLYNILILQELYLNQEYSKKINFKIIYQRYLKGLFKIYYLKCYNNEKIMRQKRQQANEDDQLPVFKESKQQNIEEKIKEIQKMDDSKLIALIMDIPQEKDVVEIYKSMKKLIPLLQNAHTRYHIQNMQQIHKTLHSNQQVSLPLYCQEKSIKDLKQSLTQIVIPYSDSRNKYNYPKTYKFEDFSKKKKEVVCNSNSLISQKLIIQKALDQLQNKQQNLYLSLEIDQMQQSQIHQVLQLGEVLQDFDKYQETSNNQSIYAQISSINCIQYENKVINEIKILLSKKEFGKIFKNYDVKNILKVINDEFYANITQNIAINQNQKKKLNRANTLKNSILDSKIISLLEALDGLRLYNSTVKIRILRACLVSISSEQLMSIQQYLLLIFKLNLLLDPKKHYKSLFSSIITNIKQIDSNISLQKYEIIIKIVKGFLQKVKQECLKMNLVNRQDKENNEVSYLYLQYIHKIKQNATQMEEKIANLKQIMRKLGRSYILQIHQNILELFEQNELYLSYLQLIHQVFTENQ